MVRTNTAYSVDPDSPDERDREMDIVRDAHLRNRLVFDLATHPAVLAEVGRAAGPDLVLWRTQFWIKEPGARRLEWHQDLIPNQGLHDRDIVTAWIAIDEVPPESAVRLVPGTHTTVRPRVFEDADYDAALRTSRALPPPPSPIDGAPVVMSLRPGGFFIFHQLVVHASPPNHTGSRRVGLAARFLRTDVDPRGIPDPCIRVAGRARSRGIRLVAPPPRSEWATNSMLLTRLRLGRKPWQRGR
jgi:ectoine hydroxylase-related dioxygenase (phytanoyl-CoA dioxygenase family)